MFHASSKKLLLAVLVACFAIQSALVYMDDVDLVLSEEAVEGRKIFHEQSCQVCHQLWGQGGFLGPDLTNAASRVDETRLVSLLTVGSGQMPAFDMTPEQIGAMKAFLEEIDRPDLGLGELRLGDPSSSTSPQAAFEDAVEEAGPTGPAGRGFEDFRSGICSSCHFPFQTSIVGAPDLSTVTDRLDDDAIREILANGRIERGMPPPAPPLSAEQRDDMVAYFHWLSENRTSLRSAAAALQSQGRFDWSRLTWWEYR